MILHYNNHLHLTCQHRSILFFFIIYQNEGLIGPIAYNIEGILRGSISTLSLFTGQIYVESSLLSFKENLYKFNF